MTTAPTQVELDALTDKISAHLSPTLLKEPYKSQWTRENPTYGFCSVASEAAWFVLGGSSAGWTAWHARDDDGTTHWWLQHASGLRYDPTRAQYDRVGRAPPYERGLVGTPGGFMGIRVDPQSEWGNERRPSLRARTVLAAMAAPPPSVRRRP